MADMKLRRVVGQFLDRGVNSVRLGIEHFNRPYDEGRTEAVLHFMLHSHEMLTKAILLNRGKKIQERRDSKTISFGRALNLLDQAGENVLDESDKLSLIALSNVRDAAQHSVVHLSEQELYLHAQAAVTVFGRLVRGEFDRNLADYLPERVLPISTDPPTSLELLVDREMTQIRGLLEPGRRRTIEARARIRPLLALDLAAAGEQRSATPLEVDRAAKRLKEGRDWRTVLPNLASLSLDASGAGQTYSVRLTKERTAPPVRFAETEDEAESAAILREVDVTARFPFGVKSLAGLSGITTPKATALIWKLRLKDDPEAHHMLRLGKSVFPLYSHKALREIREAAAQMDLAQVLREYRQRPP
jgi:hypothetical protein